MRIALISILGLAGLWVLWEFSSNLGASRWIDRLSFTQTTGSIYVSGPQVYTRERLVNDRYQEDAWLTSVLDDASKQHFTWDSIVHTANQTSYGVQGQFQVSPPLTAPTGEHAPGVARPDSVDHGAPELAGSKINDAQKPRDETRLPLTTEITPFQQFYQLLTYRERIRAHIIENQLDDRHDLRGNSLYRLVFDATVLPGNNTRKSARVSVSILPPEGLLDYESTASVPAPTLEDQEAVLANLTSLTELHSNPAILDSKTWVWARIYHRWLDSLGKRFEDARRSMRKAYDRNLFAPNDYNVLLESVREEARNYAAVISSLNTTLLDEQRVADNSARSDPMSVILSRAQLSAARASALLKTLNQIITDADVLLSMPEQKQVAFSEYRSVYYSGDKPNSGAKSLVQELNSVAKPPMQVDGESAVREEIQRLIDLLADEKLLWSLLSFNAPKPQLTTAQSPSVGAAQPSESPKGPGQPPTVPIGTDESCKKLRDYQNQTVDIAYIHGLDVSRDLTYFMDVSFEDRLIKSVLGLSPETDKTIQLILPLANGAGDSKVNQLPTLLGFAAVEPRFGSPGRAFDFKPRVVQLVLTKKLDCMPDALRETALSTSLGQHEVYVSEGDVRNIRKFLSEFDWEKYVQETFPSGLPTEVVYSEVQVGLINFIRAAGRRLDAFSYAFPPSEPDENVATEFVAGRQGTAALHAGGAIGGVVGQGGAATAQSTQSDVTGNETRKVIISFGNQSNSARPVFGWEIPPQTRLNPDGDYVQRASQTSLASLISLPAWWEDIRVSVDTAWVDEAQKFEPDLQPKNSQGTTIELPVNFETIDAILFDQVDRSPSIDEWAIRDLTVTPCKEASIVIPGRRLWRSAVVTIGGQKADKIYVLPDMNGIIATFKKVSIPNEWTDLQQAFQAPLTIWTSQGSDTLQFPVKFHPPSKDCMANNDTPGTTTEKSVQ